MKATLYKLSHGRSACVVVMGLVAAAAVLHSPDLRGAEPAVVHGPSQQGNASESLLTFNQSLIEGYYSGGVDPEDVDAVFWHVFSRLPDEVTIYPSENYYYFILRMNGRQIWGNIRLPAGRRERGVLSVGYSEFVDFPSSPGSPVSRSKYFTVADGLLIDEKDPFTYEVLYNEKKVVFHLHRLRQDPPERFKLAPDEKFIQRTFDESGYQFFLLFNTERNYFFWVLNEEEKVPDNFFSLGEGILVGHRSGFAFWVDPEHPDRKVLATIRKISVTRNDYYDGPFDQLADNYVDETRVSHYMELAIPSIKGRIDKYGYYTDSERPSRVALSCYGTYYTQADIINFLKQAQEAPDPYQYISRGGVPLPGTLGAAGVRTGTMRTPPGTVAPAPGTRTGEASDSAPGEVPETDGELRDEEP